MSALIKILLSNLSDSRETQATITCFDYDSWRCVTLVRFIIRINANILYFGLLFELHVDQVRLRAIGLPKCVKTIVYQILNSITWFAWAQCPHSLMGYISRLTGQFLLYFNNYKSIRAFKNDWFIDTFSVWVILMVGFAYLNIFHFYNLIKL